MCYPYWSSIHLYVSFVLLYVLRKLILFIEEEECFFNEDVSKNISEVFVASFLFFSHVIFFSSSSLLFILSYTSGLQYYSILLSSLF